MQFPGSVRRVFGVFFIGYRNSSDKRSESRLRSPAFCGSGGGANIIEENGKTGGVLKG